MHASNTCSNPAVVKKRFGKCQIEKSDRRTGRLKTDADSDDLPVFYPLFLEAVVNAQTNIAARFRQGVGTCALAVRLVVFIKDIVDGEVDV